MKSLRYTESQALFGLREAWQDFTGVDDAFDANTQIVAFMKLDGSWDELDLNDVFRGIERFFGFSCPDEEWTNFFGFHIAKHSLAEWEQSIAPNLTFGSLARFIADRAPAIASFDPICIFGRQCALAGVFTGIQLVANKTTGKQLRFAPSTRIIEVLRGQDLDAFWAQLRWMTEHATPKLPAFWSGVTSVTGCFGILAIVVALIATWATSNVTLLIPTVLVSFISYAMAMTYKQFTNPLPSNIVTFRDLSAMIAAKRS